MGKFNILYKGQIIHRDLSYEQSSEVLDELAEKFYNEGEFDPEFLELEVIDNGSN